MNILKLSSLAFKAEPRNYAKIDDKLSRSAQPLKEDFQWLKEQGVTDIINFRTMVVGGVDFDEESEVLKLGMKYHNIPSITNKPQLENVNKFLTLVENVKKLNGKVHIHCKAGADRTGMYAFIYKMVQGLGTLVENEKEWVARGHNTTRYPELRSWTKNILKKL